MKIAFLNIYQNKVNRGAETFVSELSKRLSKNHSVDVVSDINYLALYKKHYDLIIPTNGRVQGFATRIITWLTGAKMIVSGQSGVGFDDRLNLYSMPDVFVAISSYALEKSKKRNPFVKVVKIPNGVDLEKFKIKNLKLKIKNSYKTVLSVGAFTENKRHDLTIKAVSKIKDVKLIIAGGGGDLKQQIYDLGCKMLGKNKFKLLQVDHNNMPEIYNKANLLVFPTVPWESFGIVLVEAMASGLAVVATDDPIRREIVGNAGLFVDPVDTDAYAKAIEKALSIDWDNKQSLAKLGLGKPRKQAEKFDWDNIAIQYEELFKSL